jgi:hypothetical protein
MAGDRPSDQRWWTPEVLTGSQDRQTLEAVIGEEMARGEQRGRV